MAVQVLLDHYLNTSSSLYDDLTDPMRMPTTSLPEEQEVDPYVETLKFHLSRTRFIIQRILVPLIVSFGVVGNTMEILVLTRRWMRSSTNCYLTALAIFDTLYLLFSFLMSMSHWETVKTANWYTYFKMPIAKPLIDIWSNTAVWLIVTFTIERYIAVCYPIKGKLWCTPERARQMIIIVCISAAVITLPEFFEYRIVTKNEGNKTVIDVDQTEFAKWPSYKWGYIYTNQTLFTFIPLTLLTVFNFLLMRAVMQATRQRMEMQNVGKIKKQEKQHSEQQRITIMLISVVMSFLLCQLPQAIQNLYVTYLQISDSLMTDRKRYTITILNNVFNLLVIVNASINFVLYSTFSTKFRKTYHRLFCKCCIKKETKDELFSGAITNSPKTSKSNVYVQHNQGTTRTVKANHRSPDLRMGHKTNGYSPIDNGCSEAKKSRSVSML